MADSVDGAKVKGNTLGVGVLSHHFTMGQQQTADEAQKKLCEHSGLDSLLNLAHNNHVKVQHLSLLVISSLKEEGAELVIEGAEGVRPLVELSTFPDAEVQRDAVWSLAILGAHSTCRVRIEQEVGWHNFRKYSQSELPDVQAALAILLGNLALEPTNQKNIIKKGAELLMSMINITQDQKVRRAVITALSNISIIEEYDSQEFWLKDGLPLIIQHLDSNDYHIKVGSLNTIANLLHHTNHVESIRNRVIDLARNKFVPLIQVAGQDEMIQKLTTMVISKLAAHDLHKLELSTQGVVKPLVALLDSKDEEVRLGTAMSINVLADDKSLVREFRAVFAQEPLIEVILVTKDKEVKAEAREALIKLAPEEVDDLNRKIETRKQEKKALAINENGAGSSSSSSDVSSTSEESEYSGSDSGSESESEEESKKNVKEASSANVGKSDSRNLSSSGGSSLSATSDSSESESESKSESKGRKKASNNTTSASLSASLTGSSISDTLSESDTESDDEGAPQKQNLSEDSDMTSSEDEILKHNKREVREKEDEERKKRETEEAAKKLRENEVLEEKRRQEEEEAIRWAEEEAEKARKIAEEDRKRRFEEKQTESDDERLKKILEDKKREEAEKRRIEEEEAIRRANEEAEKVKKLAEEQKRKDRYLAEQREKEKSALDLKEKEMKEERERQKLLEQKERELLEQRLRETNEQREKEEREIALADLRQREKELEEKELQRKKKFAEAEERDKQKLKQISARVNQREAQNAGENEPEVILASIPPKLESSRSESGYSESGDESDDEKDKPMAIPRTNHEPNSSNNESSYRSESDGEVPPSSRETPRNEKGHKSKSSSRSRSTEAIILESESIQAESHNLSHSHEIVSDHESGSEGHSDSDKSLTEASGRNGRGTSGKIFVDRSVGSSRSMSRSESRASYTSSQESDNDEEVERVELERKKREDAYRKKKDVEREEVERRRREETLRREENERRKNKERDSKKRQEVERQRRDEDRRSRDRDDSRRARKEASSSTRPSRGSKRQIESDDSYSPSPSPERRRRDSNTRRSGRSSRSDLDRTDSYRSRTPSESSMTGSSEEDDRRERVVSSIRDSGTQPLQLLQLLREYPHEHPSEGVNRNDLIDLAQFGQYSLTDQIRNAMDIIPLLIFILSRYPPDKYEEIVGCALYLLAILVRNQANNQRIMRTHNGAREVEKLIKAPQEIVQQKACLCLGAYCLNNIGIQNELTETIPELCDFLKSEYVKALTKCTVAATLSSLCDNNRKNQDKVREHGGIAEAIRLLQSTDSSRIPHKVFLNLISALVSSNPNSQFEVLTNHSNLVDILLDLLSHPPSVALLPFITNTIVELCKKNPKLQVLFFKGNVIAYLIDALEPPAAVDDTIYNCLYILASLWKLKKYQSKIQKKFLHLKLPDKLRLYVATSRKKEIKALASQIEQNIEKRPMSSTL